MVAFKVPPEQSTQAARQVDEGGVIEHRLAFLQVGDEDVADRAAGDGVAVDQLSRAELTLGAERPDRGRGLRAEYAHLV